MGPLRSSSIPVLLVELSETPLRLQRLQCLWLGLCGLAAGLLLGGKHANGLCECVSAETVKHINIWIVGSS